MPKKPARPARAKKKRAPRPAHSAAPPKPAPKPPVQAHPALMPQAEYARHRGVSREAVGKAVREGRIKVDSRGRIDWVAADLEWERNTTPRAGAEQLPSARGAAGVVISLVDAKTMHELAKARLAELDLAERTKELVRRADVYSAAMSAARTARDTILSIEDRLPETLVGITDPEIIRKALHVELMRVIDCISGVGDNLDGTSEAAAVDEEESA